MYAQQFCPCALEITVNPRPDDAFNITNHYNKIINLHEAMGHLKEITNAEWCVRSDVRFWVAMLLDVNAPQAHL